MKGALLVTLTAASLAAPLHDLRVPVDGASLYAREIGQGPAIIVLHGGPDFDQSYLSPDLDRLADKFRLIYYDQRGRGRSGDGVRPEDVSLASDIDDIDRVRAHFRLESAIVLGHSWGGLLALEYAIRHPDRVSRLILMNPAPVSVADYQQFRQAYRDRLGPDLDRLRAVTATEGYKRGDPDAVAAYYAIHFKPALERQADVDTIVARIKASAARNGVLKARAVEDRLDAETWLSNGYDLLPKARALHVPTLVIYGDHDFIPKATVEHIADAVPGARLVTFAHCGHFPFLECPRDLRRQLEAFITAKPAAPRR